MIGPMSSEFLSGDSSGPPASRSPSPAQLDSIEGWGLFSAGDATHLNRSGEEEGVALIAQSLLARLDELSDEETDDERSEEGDGECREPIISGHESTFSLGSEPPRKRAREMGDSTNPTFKWFPWHDKITCTLDILMHLPRSVFSQRQLDLFLWLLKVNNVDDVPSVRSMQALNATLQKMCGIDSIKYKGTLGHTYYVNNLSQIIAQEMANPKVRPHLRFYPEDNGNNISEARHARRWLHEMDDSELSPMARLGSPDYYRDFYIHEPAQLQNGEYCIPVRWFQIGEVLFAKCWKMETMATDYGYGWRVVQCDDYTVSHAEFLKCFPDLCSDTENGRSAVPHPSRIFDCLKPDTQEHASWTFTNPVIGNRWRALAKSHRALAFPIWMYCDDTSGNLSKKWNEHNSFLFTPAGLPRTEAQKEYNIHFLSTSNIAPPLEMMEGIVEQLEELQQDGIWAWDCVESQPVLLIPMVLALLGDNPMQSEFACHIGLRGKFFCRACWVKGRDDLAENGEQSFNTAEGDSGSDAASVAESTVNSEASNEQSDSEQARGEGSEVATDASPSKKPKGRCKKIQESLGGLVQCAKDFIKIGKPRHKAETVAVLDSMYEKASTLDTKTKVKDMRTASGVKDTHQLFFLEKLFKSYKNSRGREDKQHELQKALDALPADIKSPAFRLGALDPNQDTPVKILHVVLLGFVKYLWRDLVQNQIGDNDVKKELLMTRLSSFDVSGLGISPLAGYTLVRYSGSLTGRDFRAIAQVAPFVAYDMVSKDCLATWVALSKLIPLIWQPEIEDIDAHCDLLDREIRHFLLCAGRWTIRWYNKPKFHIFLHLTEHIRRFGPAILFATEAFESFNAIIRAKSVHSNRHAPSRDIAKAFAQGNRVRHILSGGHFLFQPLLSKSTAPPTPINLIPSAPSSSSDPKRKKNSTPFSFDRCDWHTAGDGARSLVYRPNTVTNYLGLDDKKPIQQGACVSDGQPARPYSETLSGAALPAHSIGQTRGLFRSSREVYLQNGDKCVQGQFVIAKDPVNIGVTYTARVDEILNIQNSIAHLGGMPDCVLLQLASLSRTSDTYSMPLVDLSRRWALVKLDVILCTVNTPHNCAAHECTTVNTRPVIQEREVTEHTRPVVSHLASHDVVLNTAQMRDAVHLQKFRIASEDLNEEIIITASAAREIAARKAGKITSSIPKPQPKPKSRNPASAPLGQPRRLAALQASHDIT
ncbi:hypothetical protein HWV62_41769 [Athelia sp. TMB]|nr:hypothetical protein HWV62_41769 [Athelia sp. TMB]